ncbi:muscle M-line assembly protein unc-89-like isoform X2 [Sitophilus oryzae]|uniref:Muscle M-line assembly protein unc-89-like isoform X2 n=1 Tax=Sitophilus oryzae TaxID=7048 RepID=A0A6J2YV71_SITOR|nr:muscle M-line assembly protein unc-89-like isoform X2 [Sitophilus oryzae]
MGNAHAKQHPRLRNKKQVHWKAAGSCLGKGVPESFDLVRPDRPGKPILLQNADGTPDLVTLRWTPPINDGGSPISGYLVEHRRVGSPHWVRATPLPTPYPEITLSGLEPGWRYQFRVSAENAVGYSDLSEVSEAITVTLQRSAVTAPQFTQDVVDTVALENNKCEFVSHFLGQPPPKVCWFKDGFEIFSSRRIRILTEHDRSILTIHQTSLSDEGEIKCTATNRAGHASSKARLTVEAPPSIRLPRNYEEGLLFEIGEIIRLKVSVVGRPTPLVFWSHNGESVQNSDRHEIEFVDKSTVLKVSEVTRPDRGEYLIRAVNKLGEDSASFLVTVTDKPSPPGKARVVMALGRSVTLSWTTPQDDGGCKIGNYIVEYYRLGWNVWLKAATSRQLTTILGDLIEGSEYKFRVKAESPYGVSDPSEESEVIFIPDPKRGITQPPSRGRSQPNDFFEEPQLPLPNKRKNKTRSQSSSRAEHQSTILENNIEPPQRPKRTKTKSQPQSPEPSPMVQRREPPFSQINKAIFDRASLARDLAYGSPEIKIQKENVSVHQAKPVNVPASLGSGQEFNPDHAVYKVKIEPSQNEEKVESSKKVVSPEVKKKLIREHSATVSGSSEFMLVLYSDESEKDRTDIFNFHENSIPPPLSLSAPELSGLEELQFLPLKNSASSTELLHERAIMRFYQAAEEEEKELERIRNSNPEKSLALEIPRIQINSKDSDDIVGLDRRHSLRRKMSAGSVSQQAKWAQKRHSLKNSSELSEDLIPHNLKKAPVSENMKRDLILNQSALSDEEVSDFKKKQIPARLYSQNSFERKPVTIEEEERWMEEYEESMSESESGSESEVERFKFEVSRSRKVQLDESIADEDITYRPAGGLGNLRKFSNEPFEILSTPKDLPDPNFIPKPILKNSPSMSPTVSPPLSPTKVARALSPRPDVVLQRNRSKSLAVPALPPLISASSGDESDEPKKPRSRSSSLTLTNLWEHTKELSKPKPIKKAPTAKLPNISAVAEISGITAASIVIPDNLLSKKKDEEATRVVADHYDSIVKSVGQRRKSNPQIYLDRDSLKRVAEEMETPQEELPSSKEETPSKENLSQDSGYQSVSGYRRSSFTDHYDTFPIVSRSPNRKTSLETSVFYRNQEQNIRRNSLTEYSLEFLPNQQKYSVFTPPSPNKEQNTRKDSLTGIYVPKKSESTIKDSESVIANKETNQFRRNSQTKNMGVQLTNFDSHQGRNTLPKGRRSVSRSKSPSKRGTSVSRRQVGLSPARPENWSGMTHAEGFTRPKRSSPSPMRRTMRAQRDSKCPSPQPRRAPMLKEITTQTSGFLESFSQEFAHSSEKLKRELETRAEIQVRSAVDWLTDLAMFIVASWFYLFSNELLAIPILLVMVYRQLKEEIRKRIPEWMAKRFRKKN